jgi:MFS family permease
MAEPPPHDPHQATPPPPEDTPPAGYQSPPEDTPPAPYQPEDEAPQDSPSPGNETAATWTPPGGAPQGAADRPGPYSPQSGPGQPAAYGPPQGGSPQPGAPGQPGGHGPQGGAAQPGPYGPPQGGPGQYNPQGAAGQPGAYGAPQEAPGQPGGYAPQGGPGQYNPQGAAGQPGAYGAPQEAPGQPGGYGPQGGPGQYNPQGAAGQPGGYGPQGGAGHFGAYGGPGQPGAYGQAQAGPGWVPQPPPPGWQQQPPVGWGRPPAVRRGPSMVGAVFSVVAVAIGLFGMQVASQGLSASAPEFEAALGMSFTMLDWVFNIYPIVLVAVLLSAGRLADLVGRKIVFGAGALVYLVGLAATGFTPNTVVLLGGQGVAAVGEGLMLAAGLGAVFAAFPGRRLAWPLAGLGGAYALSYAAGPVISRGLVEGASWRVSLLVWIPVVLIAGVLGTVFIANDRRVGPPDRTLDLLGVPLLGGALFAWMLGLTSQSTNGWDSVLTIAALVLAVLATAGALAVGLAVRPQVLPGRLLAAAGSNMLGWTAAYVALNTITFNLTVSNGNSSMGTALRMLVTAIGFIPAVVGGAALTYAFGPRPALIAGGLVGALADVVLAAAPFRLSDGVAMALLVVVGAGLGLLVMGGMAAIAETVPDGLAGYAGGMQQAAVLMGTMVALTAFFTYQSHGSALLGVGRTATLLIAVLPGVLGAVFGLFAAASRRGGPGSPPNPPLPQYSGGL